MTETFTNMAKRGDPNPVSHDGQEVEWKRYEKADEHKQFFIFGNDLACSELSPEVRDRIEFWNVIVKVSILPTSYDQLFHAKMLGAIQIIPNTFLTYFRPPFPHVTWNLIYKKNYNKLEPNIRPEYKNIAHNFGKIVPWHLGGDAQSCTLRVFFK